MKRLSLTPLGGVIEITTGSPILKGLLSQQIPVSTACGGKGVCASCHVYIRKGDECLTPLTPREEMTLRLIVSAESNSRLACQARLLADGAVVELPSGLYVTSIDNVEELIGTKAKFNYLHPVTGAVLIHEGKIITRSVIQIFRDAIRDLQTARSS
jgi:ferredoxin